MKKSFDSEADLDGFDELPDEEQAKVTTAWAEGHVADEDIPESARKPDEEGTDGEDGKKTKTKEKATKKRSKVHMMTLLVASHLWSVSIPQKDADDDNEAEEDEDEKPKKAAKRTKVAKLYKLLNMIHLTVIQKKATDDDEEKSSKPKRARKSAKKVGSLNFAGRHFLTLFWICSFLAEKT